MTTFTYTSDTDLPDDTFRLVRGWANRRDYPVAFDCCRRSVTVNVDAPTTCEHNRAVRSLTHILDRAIARADLGVAGTDRRTLTYKPTGGRASDDHAD